MSDTILVPFYHRGQGCVLTWAWDLTVLTFFNWNACLVSRHFATHFQHLVRQLHFGHISPFYIGPIRSGHTRGFFPQRECFTCWKTDVWMYAAYWLLSMSASTCCTYLFGKSIVSRILKQILSLVFMCWKITFREDLSRLLQSEHLWQVGDIFHRSEAWLHPANAWRTTDRKLLLKK